MRACRPSHIVVVGRVALLLAPLVAVGLFHVWSHTRVTAAGYRLGELQRAQESLRAERDRLAVEVATLRAPGRLEAFARARLGMAPPAPGAVVAGEMGERVAGRAGGWGGDKDRPASPAEPVAQHLVGVSGGTSARATPPGLPGDRVALGTSRELALPRRDERSGPF
ncbi:MAG TPA: cell division protein FtsL [Anaeromyxobacteraceae bacterium]|nr:cell division protein FtsL [Anaeromyxobacteraceae bacterium]